MQVQLQALGRGLGAVELHCGSGEARRVERPVGQDEASRHGRLGVQGGVQDLEQLIGRAEGGCELVAARRRAA